MFFMAHKRVLFFFFSCSFGVCINFFSDLYLFFGLISVVSGKLSGRLFIFRFVTRWGGVMIQVVGYIHIYARLIIYKSKASKPKQASKQAVSRKRSPSHRHPISRSCLTVSGSHSLA